MFDWPERHLEFKKMLVVNSAISGLARHITAFQSCLKDGDKDVDRMGGYFVDLYSCILNLFAH